MDQIHIIETKDGSSSLLNVSLNETYHSTHGAIQESKHVFIETGLKPFLDCKKNELSILEIGFGTGLNALLTIQSAKQFPIKIYYETIEAFPLVSDIITNLNYPQLLNAEDLFSQIHHSPWSEVEEITPNFKLNKRAVKLQEAYLENEKFDLIYFDAFAPAKQPEMWELSILTKIILAMKPNGIFVTYCAKGQLRRDLISLGLVVEKLPGPPGKREMIRAKKI